MASSFWLEHSFEVEHEIVCEAGRTKWGSTMSSLKNKL